MKLKRTALALMLVAACLVQTACGTSSYSNLAKGLYAISVGFDKLERFNEAEFRAGDIDKATADKLNNDIIRAVGLKKRANELMGTIDPNAPTATDINSVLDLVSQAAAIASEAQQAGELGIKSATAKNTFGLIMTGITGGIAIARAVKQ